MASRPVIQQMVPTRLRVVKVPCQLVDSHRDFGVQLILNKTRRTGILMSRLKPSKKRLRVTTRLVKLDRAARKLSRPGAMLQALWGIEVLGIAHTTFRSLRPAVAAASGINQASRCAATAHAFCKDRAVGAALRLVRGLDESPCQNTYYG